MIFKINAFQLWASYRQVTAEPRTEQTELSSWLLYDALIKEGFMFMKCIIAYNIRHKFLANITGKLLAPGLWTFHLLLYRIMYKIYMCSSAFRRTDTRTQTDNLSIIELFTHTTTNTRILSVFQDPQEQGKRFWNNK